MTIYCLFPLYMMLKERQRFRKQQRSGSGAEVGRQPTTKGPRELGLLIDYTQVTANFHNSQTAPSLCDTLAF